MLVKLNTVMCGPLGNFAIGQVADFDAVQAKALIDGGYAEAVAVPSATAMISAPETAMVAVPETAALSTPKRGRRAHAA